MASSSSPSIIVKEDVDQIVRQELGKNAHRINDLLLQRQLICQGMDVKQYLQEHLRSLPVNQQVMLSRLFLPADDTMDNQIVLAISKVTDLVLDLMQNKVDLLEMLEKI